MEYGSAEYKVWASKLAPGDTWEALVHAKFGYGVHVRVCTVEKLTPSLIVLRDGSRFRRTDLRQYGGDSYYRLPKPATEEELDPVRKKHEHQHQQIVAKLNSTNWSALDTPVLSSILATITKKE